MKSNYFTNALACIIVSFFVLMSCKKQENDILATEKGFISLNLNQNSTFIETSGKMKAVNVSDFVVEIYNQNNTLIYSYNKLSDVPSEIELDKGEYFVVAHSSGVMQTAFDNPYYYGQSNHFIIIGGDKKNISITCYIANVKITVVYSDSVKKAFTDYTVSVFNTSDTLTFVKDDTKSGYFKAGTLNLQAHLFCGAQEKILSGCITNAMAMKHYEIFVDASAFKGTSSLQVTAIDSVTKEVISLTETPTVVSKTMDELVAGNIIISEVLPDPAKTSDDVGEWFEIFNNTSFAINLNGITFKVGSKAYNYSGDKVLNAQSYGYFGKDIQGGAGAIAYYGAALSLVNTSGGIQVYNSNLSTAVLLSEMTYSSSTSGASLSLDPSKLTFDDAKQQSSWCTATQVFSTGDKGTPGLSNSACN